MVEQTINTQAESYTYIDHLEPAKLYLQGLVVLVVVLLNEYLARDIFALAYIEYLIPFAIMAIVFSAAIYLKYARVTVNADGIQVVGRRKTEEYNWDEIESAKLSPTGMKLVRRPEAGRVWWKLAKSRHVLTVPFKETKAFSEFIPTTVEINDATKKHLENTQVPIWIFAGALISFSLLLICWVVVIELVTDYSTNKFMLTIIIAGLPLLHAIAKLFNSVFERYDSEFNTTRLEGIEFGVHAFIMMTVIYIMFGINTLGYLLLVFGCMVLGMLTVLTRLMRLVARQTNKRSLGLIVVFFLTLLWGPSSKFIWEFRALDVTELNLDNKTDYQFLESYQSKWSRDHDQLQSVSFCVTWPDGRKAICASPMRSDKSREKNPIVYYYSPKMEKLGQCEIIGMSVLARRAGDVVSWYFYDSATEAKGIACSKFGGDKFRTILGDCHPVSNYGDNEKNEFYYIQKQDNASGKIMKYSWAEDKSSEITSDGNIEMAAFMGHDKYGYVTTDEQNRYVKIWERGVGLREVAQKPLEDKGNINLSPYLTHAYYSCKAMPVGEVIGLEDSKKSKVWTKDGKLTWGPEHLMVGGSIYQLNTRELKKLDIELPKLEGICFSPDGRYAVGSAGDFLKTKLVLIDLGNRQIRFLMSYASGFTMRLTPETWRGAEYTHISEQIMAH